MNVFKIVLITIALAAGAGAAQASPWDSHDACTTVSTHGVWDCR